ncbi:hypothetical protein OIDMADRAFT_21566 [Oidiodendron maius Zn]|uniref:Uncharacterized protein n=1 Tax=Oidiodendron maius (strain Zn) TaxID=913774 RepID=A0A0C3GNZ3_OIDMZ|nr:hypothetical protein OIDMADRAFT_21566 [Oidiodendron maius Zn]
MAKGDSALSGEEEKFSTHYFPPSDNDREICFKGRYLSIYNKQTEHYETHIDNDTPSTEYKKYKVPAGYTVYVRGGTVYFEV